MARWLFAFDEEELGLKLTEEAKRGFLSDTCGDLRGRRGPILEDPSLLGFEPPQHATPVSRRRRRNNNSPSSSSSSNNNNSGGRGSRRWQAGTGRGRIERGDSKGAKRMAPQAPNNGAASGVDGQPPTPPRPAPAPAPALLPPLPRTETRIGPAAAPAVAPTSSSGGRHPRGAGPPTVAPTSIMQVETRANDGASCRCRGGGGAVMGGGAMPMAQASQQRMPRPWARVPPGDVRAQAP